MIMPKTNNERLQTIASAMQELNARLVYVGGAMAGAYATDPTATEPRTTLDVLQDHPLQVTGDVLLIAGDSAYLDLPESRQDTYSDYAFWDWASANYRWHTHIE